MASKLSFERRGALAWITLDRPECRTVLDPEIMGLLLDAGLDEVLENERFHQQDIFRTEDFAEGVQAFLQKRPAVYKGR